MDFSMLHIVEKTHLGDKLHSPQSSVIGLIWLISLSLLSSALALPRTILVSCLKCEPSLCLRVQLYFVYNISTNHMMPFH